MPKLALAAQGGDHDPRTAHLRPVIEHLLAQGNTPASWRGDAFAFDQGGEGHYLFAGPLDAAELRERFAFPVSIRVYDDGSIKDSLNRMNISRERTRRKTGRRTSKSCLTMRLTLCKTLRYAARIQYDRNPSE